MRKKDKYHHSIKSTTSSTQVSFHPFEMNIHFKTKIFIMSFFLSLLQLLFLTRTIHSYSYSTRVLLSSSRRRRRVPPQTQCFAVRRPRQQQQRLLMAIRQMDYDIVVIGAGASGMFAAGTASSFGSSCKTLLVDKHDLEDDVAHTNDFYMGGDCTNSACIPSKAIRCAARVAAMHERASAVLDGGGQSMGGSSGSSSNKRVQQQQNLPFSSLARRYSQETTNKVRSRESPDRIASTPNLDIIYTPRISFVDSHRLSIENPYFFNSTFSDFLLESESTTKGATPNDNNDDDDDLSQQQHDGKCTTVQVFAKKIVICTGAGPMIPEKLYKSAKKIGLPLLTYRSIFKPDGEGKDSDFLWNMKKSTGSKMKRVVIVGGGGTACEIAQSLARLNKNVQITMVAPGILDKEDIAARVVARKILMEDGVNLVIGKRVMNASRMGQIAVVELDDKTQLPVDILICATGRFPGKELEELKLDNAGVQWTAQDGVIVNKHLQSVSQKNIYAAGDCISAVPKLDRRASHAAWMGYHAIQSALFPKFLLASDAIHPFVPRVTFLDPEVASIGKTRADCVREFGSDGFRYLKVHENGTDRSDIDSIEGRVEGFVELRISKPEGRILGATVCSPVASEIVNEIGVAMVNKLTVRDIARSIHAYPSHGYLMHRVALSLALSDTWGVLDAMGPIARVVGKIGRKMQGNYQSRRRRRKTSSYLRDWEALGEEKELQWERKMISVPYLEASQDTDFCNVVRLHVNDATIGVKEKQALKDFLSWLDSKPPR
jgi:Pyruvate/2-oxoglutarate dehydrogenase complex, dihydrolipoamide dehydrogenase (E3) component, and related enzymes